MIPSSCLRKFRAGEYELLGGTCGAFLRQGQIVRVEVGFRIVPAGPTMSAMRMDLKSVTIIDDDIVTVSSKDLRFLNDY